MLIEKMISLQQIAQKCERFSGIFDFSNSNIERIWQTAFFLRKRMLNNGEQYQHETIRNFEFYSETKKSLVNYKLTAATKLTRHQIFVLVYMNESFCSLEATEQIIESI
jgi:hypothetical protein